MRKDTKNKTIPERQEYAPAKMKVIEVSPQRVICKSGDTEDSEEGDTSGWLN